MLLHFEVMLPTSNDGQKQIFVIWSIYILIKGTFFLQCMDWYIYCSMYHGNDTSKYYYCILHICCSTLRFLTFVWPALGLILTNFTIQRLKLFEWQAFSQKEKGRFATRLTISVMTNFFSSNIVVPESCCSLRFYSMCLYVSYADSYQVYLP